MAFEVFSAYGAGARDAATLRASGYLFIPRAMMQAIGGVSTKHVVLMFDKENNQLAIRLPEEQDPEYARREVAHEKSGTVVNVIPLLRTYKLEQPQKKLKLPAKVSDEAPWVLVDMNEAKEIPF